MRWIARFFLIIALAFLTLDLLDSGEPAPAAIGGTGGAVSTTEKPASDAAAVDKPAGENGAGEVAADEKPAAGTPAAETPAVPAADAAPARGAAPNRVMLYSLGERWFHYHPGSYQQISPAVSRHVSPWLDDNIVQPLMLQPAFLIFFLLSLLFSFFSWLIGRARADHDDY